MTKKAVEENENVGKMDWDVMNKVLKNTINLDDEGTVSHTVDLSIIDISQFLSDKALLFLEGIRPALLNFYFRWQRQT